ncbi:hypothetical protein F4810DRAFT_619136 [Camillea tinctor]|nr:hypothetical protein F4810DRAFT_619136 [Camillea tinctor]
MIFYCFFFLFYLSQQHRTAIIPFSSSICLFSSTLFVFYECEGRLWKGRGLLYVACADFSDIAFFFMHAASSTVLFLFPFSFFLCRDICRASCESFFLSFPFNSSHFGSS